MPYVHGWTINSDWEGVMYPGEDRALAVRVIKIYNHNSSASISLIDRHPHGYFTLTSRLVNPQKNRWKGVMTFHDSLESAINKALRYLKQRDPKLNAQDIAEITKGIHLVYRFERGIF